MKAPNEFEPMQPESPHQKLCAYVLGETSPDERAEIETALAGSAELRAEKARLEGTIGLVRTAFTGSEALSGDAMARLMEVAGGAERSPSAPALGAWFHSPALRAAAAVVALLGGVALIVTSAGDSMTRDSEVVGKADRRYTMTSGAGPGQVPSLDGFAGGSGLEEPEATFERELAQLGALNERTAVLAPADKARDLMEVERRAGSGAFYGDGDGAGDGDGNGPMFGREEAKKESAAEDLAGLAPRYWGVRSGEAPTERSSAGRHQAPEPMAKARAKAAVERDVLLFRADTSTRGLDLLEAQEQALDVLGLDVESAQIWKIQLDADGGSSEESWSSLGEQTEALTQTLSLGRGSGPDLGGRLSALSVSPTPPPTGPSTPGPVTGYSVDSFGVLPSGGQALGEAELPQTVTDVLGVDYRAAELGTAGNKPAEPAATENTRARVEHDFDFALADVPATAEPDLESEARAGLTPAGEPTPVFRYYFEQEDSGRGRRVRRKLTHDELELFSDQECERVIRTCRPYPNERPRDMFFRFWGDNPFEITKNDALSTFSVDVDTASYALARRYLNEGHIPTKAQVRTEEFVNYFDADLPAPTEETFAIYTELAPSLFDASGRWMLRVGVRGKEVAASERKPLALTFVVDTSGSMRENDRLELVKHAMRLLVGQLDARDSIAIVAFSNDTRLVLPMTSAASHGVIESAIHPLSPDGSTNAEAGLRMGYEVALAALDANAHNRVVFLSDGVANVGQTDQDRIAADVKAHSDRGLFLNTIGVGMNNHNDVFLEQLADHGDGICDYVDSAETAQRAIVERFTEAMVPIASDVKIQVEFDPAQVTRYRLLGYENRAIADKDFRNDKVDAGEVGAGHQVLALYEIETSSVTGAEKPLAKVMLRWKAPKVANQDPNEIDVTEISSDVSATDALASFATASPGYRRTVLVAQFAEFLRRSVHARGDSYETLMQESAVLAPTLRDADFDEFITLVKRAFALNLPAPYFTSDLDRTIDEYRRFQYLNHQLGELQHDRDAKALEDLRKTNEEMERKIRDLIRTELERKNG